MIEFLEPVTSIRPLRPEDIAAVAELLESLARASFLQEFAPEARELFLSKNSAVAIEQFVAAGFRYHVAELDSKILNSRIVGFVGIRDNKHLYHLFVAQPFQGRGIGRRLWETAAAECIAQGNPGVFTVNSSSNAVAVYERFGFKCTAPLQNVNGVLFTPMELDCNRQPSSRQDRL